MKVYLTDASRPADMRPKRDGERWIGVVNLTPAAYADLINTLRKYEEWQDRLSAEVHQP